MPKKPTSRQKPKANFWKTVDLIVGKNQLIIYLLIILFSLINLYLFANFISQISSGRFVPPSLASYNLPVLKIVTPVPNSRVSGEVPITLSYQDSEGFKNLVLLVDGTFEKEIVATGQSSLSFTLNSAKFANGVHKLTFKATDTRNRTQTLELNLNFSNFKRR